MIGSTSIGLAVEQFLLLLTKETAKHHMRSLLSEPLKAFIKSTIVNWLNFQLKKSSIALSYMEIKAASEEI